MPRGTLEVVLISAKGLDDNDFLSLGRCINKKNSRYTSSQRYVGMMYKTRAGEGLYWRGSASIDPYVILKYRSQEHKSTVKEGAGSSPQWNESFLFTVSDSAFELNIRIMDKDNFSQDDFLGEATIPIDAVVEEVSIPETAYNVVKDEEYRGEIKVALTFTAEPERYDDQGYNAEESYGGWAESNRDI